jgi:hypothetical protein
MHAKVSLNPTRIVPTMKGVLSLLLESKTKMFPARPTAVPEEKWVNPGAKNCRDACCHPSSLVRAHVEANLQPLEIKDHPHVDDEVKERETSNSSIEEGKSVDNYSLLQISQVLDFHGCVLFCRVLPIAPRRRQSRDRLFLERCLDLNNPYPTILIPKPEVDVSSFNMR